MFMPENSHLTCQPEGCVTCIKNAKNLKSLSNYYANWKNCKKVALRVVYNSANMKQEFYLKVFHSFEDAEIYALTMDLQLSPV